MSTRSRIGIERPDGSILSIYCHHDGYVEVGVGVGHQLHTHYNDAARAEKIIALGDLSSLYETLTPPAGKKHSHDNPIRGVTVAYGRDRGEKDIAARTSADREDYRGLFEEYNYLYTADGWIVAKSYGEDHEKAFRPLTVALVTDRLEA